MQAYASRVRSVLSGDELTDSQRAALESAGNAITTRAQEAQRMVAEAAVEAQRTAEAAFQRLEDEAPAREAARLAVEATGRARLQEEKAAQRAKAEPPSRSVRR